MPKTEDLRKTNLTKRRKPVSNYGQFLNEIWIHVIFSGSGEDQEAVITEGQAANIQGVPPVLAQAYKKRFPNFWRTQQGLV